MLLAAADRSDPDHDACRELLETPRGPLITTEFVVAETGWLLHRQLGPTGEVALYSSIADGELIVERLTTADWQRIAALTEQYADQPLGVLTPVSWRSLNASALTQSRRSTGGTSPASGLATGARSFSCPSPTSARGDPARRIVWALDRRQCPNRREKTANYANPVCGLDPRNRECFQCFSALPGPHLRCMACKRSSVRARLAPLRSPPPRCANERMATVRKQAIRLDHDGPVTVSTEIREAAHLRDIDIRQAGERPRPTAG